MSSINREVLRKASANIVERWKKNHLFFGEVFCFLYESDEFEILWSDHLVFSFLSLLTSVLRRRTKIWNYSFSSESNRAVFLKRDPYHRRSKIELDRMSFVRYLRWEEEFLILFGPLSGRWHLPFGRYYLTITTFSYLNSSKLVLMCWSTPFGEEEYSMEQIESINWRWFAAGVLPAVCLLHQSRWRCKQRLVPGFGGRIAASTEDLLSYSRQIHYLTRVLRTLPSISRDFKYVQDV